MWISEGALRDQIKVAAIVGRSPEDRHAGYEDTALVWDVFNE